MNRRVGLDDDSGASLLLALIIVTVFSVVVAVVLSFADTSMRTTIALRGQATQTASADGAAQIAINALRRGTFDGTGTAGQCFTESATTSSDTLTLNNFYQPASGPADSAVVTCDPDPPHNADSPVTINNANKPTNAVLTTAVTGEDGLTVNVADGRDLKVHGPVFSNSTINVPAGSLTSDASVTARGGCTSTITATPAKVCDFGAAADLRGATPDYPVSTADRTAATLPPCNGADNQLFPFSPGIYTDIGALNVLTSRCEHSILYFSPGTYYFNFPSTQNNGIWTIGTNYLVAGTTTRDLVAGTPPSMPGSCVSPVPPKPATSTWTKPEPGVQFVFAGSSQMRLVGSQAEICGTYAADRPPIAVYGLASATGGIPAESGCTVVTPYPSTTACAMISSVNSSLYIQGTTYAPRAALDLEFTNPPGLMFSAGVIARTLRLTPTTGAALGDPVIALPDNVTAGRQALVWLNVYLCSGASACTKETGTLRLRAKVGVFAPTSGRRQITVYSWSVQR